MMLQPLLNINSRIFGDRLVHIEMMVVNNGVKVDMVRFDGIESEKSVVDGSKF